jgi:ankyrin repeat protein
LAALNGQKKVVQCLLAFNADKEILNNKGQTPLLLAVGQLHASIIELLVEKSA